MARKDYTFTSESVSEGHPDKICDRISDAVLDFCLEKDSFARVACETFATTNTVVVGGEVGFKSDSDSKALDSEINSLVVNVVKEIGYEQEGLINKSVGTNDKITFYTKYGDFIFRLCLFFMMLISAFYVANLLKANK